MVNEYLRRGQFPNGITHCCTPLHEECLKHHGYKGDPGVTPGTCDDVGERACVILVWVRALSVRNASHWQRLGVTRERPWAMSSLWHVDSKMLKNISIIGVSEEMWQFEWDVVPGQRLGQKWPGSGSQDCGGLNRHNFLNICLNGANEVSNGMYVKCRWR